ncbi:MAG TPA: zinc-dependent metalloprotease [Candidatus Dormibacteraeota bacterium]
MKRKVARGFAVGIASGIATAALFELARSRGGKGRLIDWDAIRDLAAERLGREGATLTPPRRRKLEAEYARLAAEMQEPLFDVVGGPRDLSLPRFGAIGRIEWVDVNLETLRRVLEPILESSELPDSRLVDLGRAGVDRYTAVLLAFLAQRVLGQFDPQLMGHEPVEMREHALYLVEPNVEKWEREAKLPGDDLRRWLILHESTHAWQFAAHPWLADYMNEALRELLDLAAGGSSPAARVMALTVGLPAQWRLVRRMQATMSLIEGYSNLVMNLAGRKVLPAFEQLEEAYRRRSGERSALEVLFWRVTGLELKLQQYERGEAFSRAIYNRHGMQVLNLAWESPEALPQPGELERPEAWVARVTGSARPVRRPATA